MVTKNRKKTIRFRYKEDTMSNHKVFIWVWSIVLLIAYLICAWFWGFDAPSIPFFIIFIYIGYLWSRRWDSRNEETERRNALALIDKHVKEDVQRLYGDEISISNLGYHFYTDTNDESCRCVLAYLSNNKTIRYNVNEIPSGKENVCCCEIDLEPIETEERKLVRKISPNFRPLLYLSPQNEFKIRILFIYAIGFAVIVAGLIAMIYFKWIAPACLLGYIVVTVLLAYICSKMKWLNLSAFFAKRCYNVIRMLHFTVPAFDLSLVLFLSLGIGLGVPCSILYSIDNYTEVVLSKSVQYFICIVLSAIILVHHYNFVHNYILSLLFKHDFEERIKKHPFIEVALNLTQGKNINFLIYMFYFLFISWTTLARLQGFDSLFSKELIEGATPAFLVHIAYTNMVIKLKEVDLKMGTMMDFMSKAYDIRILQLKNENS